MSEESDERFYDLEDYRMTLEELDELRKQYERLRYGHAVTLRKLDALRNEVKAWRRQADVFEDTFPGQPERYQTHIEVSNARKETDTLKALEDER